MPESTDSEKRFLEAIGSAQKKVSSAARTKPVVINLFQHPDSHPIVLDLLMLRKYGPDWLGWESEYIREKVPTDFPTKDLSDLNMEKIQAVRVLHLNDTFWQRWENFNPVVQVFNNQFPDFDKMQVPTTAMLAVAVDTAKRVREDVNWSLDVIDFMRMVCRFDGVFCPPAPLDFLDVGTEHGLVDVDEIKDRWPGVRKSNKEPEEAGIVEEQLRRNLNIHRYLEEFRSRLSNQMSLVSYG